MTQEAEQAPLDHIEVKQWEKENVLTRIIENKAFSVETAMSREELVLENNENLALVKLVKQGLLMETIRENEPYYYLKEELNPEKSFRKQVAMGFSIPLLIFIIAIILMGLVAIIIGMIVGF